MLDTNEKVKPIILTLIEIGNGIGGTKVSDSTREGIAMNLHKAFILSKQRKYLSSL